MAADIILFNSHFNQNSFLDNIQKITKLFPDWRPKDLKQKIENKCKVLYFPVDFQEIPSLKKSSTLHIVWPHRWEFDKGPEEFFCVLMKLKEEKIPFKLSILGESFTDSPPIFTTVKLLMKEEVTHFGYIESKEDYYNILASAHVVVSTAKHEFFGVAM